MSRIQSQWRGRVGLGLFNWYWSSDGFREYKQPPDEVQPHHETAACSDHDINIMTPFLVLLAQRGWHTHKQWPKGVRRKPTVNSKAKEGGIYVEVIFFKWPHSTYMAASLLQRLHWESFVASCQLVDFNPFYNGSSVSLMATEPSTALRNTCRAPCHSLSRYDGM